MAVGALLTCRRMKRSGWIRSAAILALIGVGVLCIAPTAAQISDATPESLVALGDEAYRERDYPQAALAYREAVAINTTYGPAWLGLGNSLYMQEDYSQALDAYIHAIDVTPDLSDAWLDKGNALRQLGRTEEAIQAYEQAIEVNPASENAYYNLGLAYQELGNNPSASQAFDQATKLSPRDAYAWRKLGDTLYAQQKYQEAIDAYDRALAIQPGMPEAIKGRDAAQKRASEEGPIISSIPLWGYIPLIALGAAAGILALRKKNS
jgi:tetratricopeptide (TPR) repeat protein